MVVAVGAARERVGGAVVGREGAVLGLGDGAGAVEGGADGGPGREHEREHRERDEPGGEDDGARGELTLAALAVQEACDERGERDG